MILNAFNLNGKVALVTGCDTGLGQGMALGLAEAGCDIISVSRKIPEETSAKVQALGRHFTAIQADLSRQDAIADIVTKAVTAMGRIDILVNNAGTIRREDALSFSEKNWDDVINLNLKSVFFCLRRWRNSFCIRAAAGKLLILPRCSPSRAGSAYPLIPRQKRRAGDHASAGQRMGAA